MTTDDGDKQRKPLSGRTTILSLVGLVAGVVAGTLLSRGAGTGPLLSFLNGVGTLWVNALRVVAMPLAIFNTVCAMARPRTALTAGRATGAVAVYVALLLVGAGIVLLVVPPVLHTSHIDHGAFVALSHKTSVQAQKSDSQSSAPSGLGDMLVGLVPRNLVQSAANEEFLRLVVFSLLFGLAMRYIGAEAGRTVLGFFEGVTDTLMVLVRWIIWCAPVALFALAAVFAAGSGARIAGILGWFVLMECGLMLAFLLLLYPLTALVGGVRVGTFSKAALGPQMVAVSSRSSLASLPALLAAGEKMLPSNPETSRVLLPLAVSIFKVNRTTSALCRLLVIAFFWGIPMQPAQICVFLLTIILISFSDLGVPNGGSGLRSLPAYLAAGCPIEAVMMLEVIEPLSDICKTLLNVTGDLSVAAIVTRWSTPPVRVPLTAAVAAAAGSPAS